MENVQVENWDGINFKLVTPGTTEHHNLSYTMSYSLRGISSPNYTQVFSTSNSRISKITMVAGISGNSYDWTPDRINGMLTQIRRYAPEFGVSWHPRPDEPLKYRVSGNTMEVFFGRDNSGILFEYVLTARNHNGFVAIAMSNDGANKLLLKVASAYGIEFSENAATYKMKHEGEVISSFPFVGNFYGLEDFFITGYDRVSTHCSSVDSAIKRILAADGVCLDMFEIVEDADGKRRFVGDSVELAKDPILSRAVGILLMDRKKYPQSVSPETAASIIKKIEAYQGLEQIRESIIFDSRCKQLLDNRLNPAVLSGYLPASPEEISSAIQKFKENTPEEELEFEVMSSNPSTLAKKIQPFLVTKEVPELHVVSQ